MSPIGAFILGNCDNDLCLATTLLKYAPAPVDQVVIHCFHLGVKLK